MYIDVHDTIVFKLIGVFFKEFIFKMKRFSWHGVYIKNIPEPIFKDLM